MEPAGSCVAEPATRERTMADSGGEDEDAMATTVRIG